MVRISLAFVVVLACAAIGCRQPTPPAKAQEGADEIYAPGLGEIMTFQQMRHTKLWLAGEAGNWDLASYEIKELGEGFDDIIKFHPTHEESPVAPKDAIPRMIPAPIADIKAAIDKKDSKGFETAFDSLTKACNDCHKATNFGFNQLQRPTMNPYPNQVFTPAHD